MTSDEQEWWKEYDGLSHSQQMELRALTLDKQAILQVVSDLRSYRGAVKKLLSYRYRDGEVDGYTLSSFEHYIADVENGENPGEFILP